MELIYQGVVAGELSLERWVETCCTTPARMFGMYPKKGVIAPGSDADVVVWDPIVEDHDRHGRGQAPHEHGLLGLGGLGDRRQGRHRDVPRPGDRRGRPVTSVRRVMVSSSSGAVAVPRLAVRRRLALADMVAPTPCRRRLAAHAAGHPPRSHHRPGLASHLTEKEEGCEMNRISSLGRRQGRRRHLRALRRRVEPGDGGAGGCGRPGLRRRGRRRGRRGARRRSRRGGRRTCRGGRR